MNSYMLIRAWVVMGICLSPICLDAGGSPVPYDRYGRFEDVGTPQFNYRAVDQANLRKTVKPGIYPNVTPRPGAEKISMEELERMNLVRLLDSQECLNFWRTLDTGRLRDPRYTQGVRQFRYAQCLEQAGRLEEALQGYYAVILYFPGDQEPNRNFPAYWPDYLGVSAMDAIYFLTRRHPELGWRYAGGEIVVENGFDADESNDILRIWPGRLLPVPSPSFPRKRESGKDGLDARLRGHDEPEQLQILKDSTQHQQKVSLERGANGHWAFVIDARPFLVRGVHYQPPPAPPRREQSPAFWSGQGHGYWDTGWSVDRDHNGRSDIEETWMDANGNTLLDDGEPRLGDFGLMALAGVNTVVLSRWPEDDRLLQEAHRRWGLRFIFWEGLGSDGESMPEPWTERINYESSRDREKILERVQEMVRRFQDKDYVLAWAVGGQDFHRPQGPAGRAKGKAYLDFSALAVESIKAIDPQTPVFFVTRDVQDLPLVARTLAQADALALAPGRGWHGFGESFWSVVSEEWSLAAGPRPILIFDYGLPAFAQSAGRKTVGRRQADFHEAAWSDVLYHRAGGPGRGTALGGCVWEWVDTWWRSDPESKETAAAHETLPARRAPSLDGRDYPEWYGLMEIGEGPQGTLSRRPRAAYWSYVRLWRKDSP